MVTKTKLREAERRTKEHESELDRCKKEPDLYDS